MQSSFRIQTSKEVSESLRFKCLDLIPLVQETRNQNLIKHSGFIETVLLFWPAFLENKRLHLQHKISLWYSQVNFFLGLDGDISAFGASNRETKVVSLS